MTVRDPRYDILFEPVRIGPVTARNRFFQVPHCNGMGHRDPTAHAWMRGVKAEGGWAVVCTEEVEIHFTSDVAPFVEGRIWDDADIPAHARLVEKVHEHGALAGIELVHSGMSAANLYSTQPPLGPGTPAGRFEHHPVQARAMTKDDIADLRRWHRQARGRASLRAGYDLVYVYAAHGLSTLQHFLSRRYNGRARRVRRQPGQPRAPPARDPRGHTRGSRRRPLRPSHAASSSTSSSASGGLERGEIAELFAMLGELPDLWDVIGRRLGGRLHRPRASREEALPGAVLRGSRS